MELIETPLWKSDTKKIKKKKVYETKDLLLYSFNYYR